MLRRHILDRPIWSALTTSQAQLAEKNGAARRYPPEIAPFADLEDFSAESFDALFALLGPGEPAVLFTPEPVAAPVQFDTVMAATGEQMIGTPARYEGQTPEIVPLGEPDASEMRALAELTRPGPFGPRTHTLGRFFGIRIGGRLVAMTGERMRPGGYTEMTAVCVHPDHRGMGLAQALLSHVGRQIAARGEIPFLHVFSDNLSAISLYRRQGMTTRRRLHVTVLGRKGDKLGEALPH